MADAPRPGSRTPRQVRVIQDGRATSRADYLATEEPLEIRLVVAGRRQSVAITMRTPGADFELAVGFLFSEGIIAGRDDVRRVTYCTDRDVDAEQRYNIVNVELAGAAAPDLRSLERHFFTNSACGVCGKATLDALEVRCPPLAGGPDGAGRGPLRPARAVAHGTGPLRLHRRPPRHRPVHRRRRAAGHPGGRRPPQRPRQAHRLGRAPGPGAAGQRSCSSSAAAPATRSSRRRSPPACQSSAASRRPAAWPSPWPSASV